MVPAFRSAMESLKVSKTDVLMGTAKVEAWAAAERCSELKAVGREAPPASGTVTACGKQLAHQRALPLAQFLELGMECALDSVLEHMIVLSGVAGWELH